EKDVLKTLATMCPEKLFPVLFRSMQDDFDEGLDDFDIVIRSSKFNYVDLRESEETFGAEYLYQLLGICLRRSARRKATDFLIFLDNHKRSKHSAVLRLLTFALKDSEQVYASQIFELFCHFKEL